MTSDAKIGLILGLAFIVLIAFLLTGLPTIFNGSEAGGGIRTTIPAAGASVVLDDLAENAYLAIQGIDDDVEQRRVDIDDVAAGDARFVGSDGVASGATTGGSGRVNHPMGRAEKTYIVKSGENLATIAKKVYGPEEGNRFAVINKLFEANRNTMSSADDVQIGQKLVIPSLTVNATAVTPTTLREAEDAGIFTRVRSAFGNVVNRGEPNVYVVKAGESLWEIASKQLGDGSRYKEIVKLNRSSVEGNGDVVGAGVNLVLPVH